MGKTLETKDYVYVEVEIELVTSKNVLVFNNGREVYVPRSYIEDPDPEDMNQGDKVELLLPQWAAKELGLK
jgi:hypothetical protein